MSSEVSLIAIIGHEGITNQLLYELMKSTIQSKMYLIKKYIY